MKLRSGKTISRVSEKADIIEKCRTIHSRYIQQKLYTLNTMHNVVDKIKLVIELYEYIYKNLNDLREAANMCPKWERFYKIMQNKTSELIFQVCRQSHLVKSDEDIKTCIKCIQALRKVLKKH